MGTSRISARRSQNRRRRCHRPLPGRPPVLLPLCCSLSNSLMSTMARWSLFHPSGRLLTNCSGNHLRPVQASRQQKSPKGKTPSGQLFLRLPANLHGSPPHPAPTPFFHPDSTVGSGFAPDLFAQGELAGLAHAGAGLLTTRHLWAPPPVGNWRVAPHPAPKVSRLVFTSIQATLYLK
jgi:hypothetical protein